MKTLPTLKKKTIAKSTVMMVCLASGLPISSLQGALVITVDDAGAGSTTWTITDASGTVGSTATYLAGPDLGDLPFVGNTTITPTAISGTVGGVTVNPSVLSTFWLAASNWDGVNDAFYIQLSGNLTAGTPLTPGNSNASFTFPIAFSSLNLPFSGNSLTAFGEADVGTISFVSGVPEPSSAALLCLGALAFGRRR